MPDLIYEVIPSKRDGSFAHHFVFTSVFRLLEYLDSLPDCSCVHLYKVQNFIDLDFSKHETDSNSSVSVCD